MLVMKRNAVDASRRDAIGASAGGNGRLGVSRLELAMYCTYTRSRENSRDNLDTVGYGPLLNATFGGVVCLSLC